MEDENKSVKKNENMCTFTTSVKRIIIIIIIIIAIIIIIIDTN